MLKINNNMHEYIKKLSLKTNKKYFDILYKLCPEFIEVDECILIKKEDFEIKLDINKILSVYFDRTDFEASYNEFRLEDYYEGLCNNSYESVEMSIEFLKVISNRLKDKFPYYNFHIVLSYDGNYSTMRFYKLRESEETWIDLDNLDEYADEAIIVCII